MMEDQLNKRLKMLTDDIVASYHRDDSIQRIGETFLPSRKKIVEILGDIRQLLFPGYFGEGELTEENVLFHVGDLVAHVGIELGEQVYRCLCCTRRPADPQPSRRRAATITGDFLARISALREMLTIDAQAAYDGDPAAKSTDEIIHCYPGFYAVTVYRIAHELLKLGVRLMPRIMTEYAHSVTGCDIHPGAEIGKNFFIDHATGVVIGETTCIGDNVKIYQGVTLGARSFPKDERGRAIKGHKRHPTLQDNTTVYANATILGGKTIIGKGVTVGGNTFVTKSVPPGSIVEQVTITEPEVRSKKKRT